MPNPNYFNVTIGPKGDYHADWLLPNASGGGYLGSDLDSVYSDLLRQAREGGATDVLLMSQPHKDEILGIGHRQVPKKDLEFLVGLYNLDPGIGIKFRC